MSRSLTQGSPCSPLQARHSKRFQWLPKTITPYARNEQIFPQRLYGLPSRSAGSIGNGQGLWYEMTAFTPPQTFPHPLIQLLIVLHSSQTSSNPSRTAVFATTRKAEA